MNWFSKLLTSKPSNATDPKDAALSDHHKNTDVSNKFLIVGLGNIGAGGIKNLPGLVPCLDDRNCLLFAVDRNGSSAGSAL